MPDVDYDKLARSNASRGIRLKDALAKLARVEGENATLKGQVTSLTAERDALRAAKPPGAEQELPPPKVDEKPKPKDSGSSRLDLSDADKPRQTPKERSDAAWARMGRDPDDDSGRL